MKLKLSNDYRSKETLHTLKDVFQFIGFLLLICAMIALPILGVVFILADKFWGLIYVLISFLMIVLTVPLQMLLECKVLWGARQ